ncbi:hypothetical protein A167_00150 [Alcanivorax sp. S71-1-4]|uniref:porin family protein n=1 Tax=Alcanivorax sp. S71-1-4 TaxID=1177159 RepID=UPI001356993A|nr:porin family protein [Alcanivorax sp. S71-1-4]KAF0811118.1 hypothetical protein A167_00150 [Alcanivorax sp. S71-1-4]
MKTWMMIAGTAGALTFVGVAQAQEARPYFGAQYNFAEVDGGGDEAEFDVFSGRLGVEFNPFLALEARAGFGVGDDRVNGVKVELDHYYGLYAKLALANESQFTPYLLGGYTKVKTDPKLGSDNEDDFGYGIGVDFNLDQALALNLEYARLLDASDVDMDAMSLGFTYRF